MKKAKMSKKGFEISSLLGWIIGILAVFIILFIVLGPEQLLSMARDAAFSFGIGLPGEKPPTPGSDEIPEELTRYFNNLVLRIKSTKTGEKCLVDIGEVKIPSGFVISLSEGKAEIKREKEGSIGLSLKSEIIAGFKPCIVKGEAARNFHYCYLEKKPTRCNSPLFETQDEIILKEAWQEEGDRQSYSNFLFKSGENKCFIILSGAWGGGCDPPDTIGIDYDCRNKIGENIPRCT